MVFPNFAQNVFSLLDPASSYLIFENSTNRSWWIVETASVPEVQRPH